MICKNCGKEIMQDSKFCFFCGENIDQAKIKASSRGFKLFKTKTFIKLLLMFAILFSLVLGSYSIYKQYHENNITKDEVSYTKNPALESLPIKSVVKIIVNEGTEKEISGSGLLFTKDGNILTNAHVVSTILGRPEKNIKVCYTDQDNLNIKCDYDAKVVDSDSGMDLAVIKVDKKITEIEPYLLVVEEDDELNKKEILQISSDLTVVGYPGVGSNTITVSKGIVSGYQNHEYGYYDGSIHIISDYIKTDSEINFGNSGGAAFDKENRYIGIPSYIKKDDGGKIGYIIFWNRINNFLRDLVYKDKLKLDDKQYIKRNIPSSEVLLWEGIKAFARKDYDIAKDRFDKYLKENKTDSRGWNSLCNIYLDLEDYDNLGKCAEELRSLNNESMVSSWMYSSMYNFFRKEPDYNKAYEMASNAYSILPDNIGILNLKTFNALQINKNSEAEELNNKTMKLDESDSSSWFLKGLMAAKNNKIEEALTYLEYSFYLSPEPSSASILAQAYFDSDWQKSLQYSIASLVLESKDLNDLFRASNLIAAHFVDDQDSLISAFNNTKKVLLDMELDRELIEKIENIEDKDIEKYLKETKSIKDVTQEQINNNRQYVEIVSSWLYTFIGEKDLCKKYTNDKNAENLVTFFESLDFSKDESVSSTRRFYYMDCFCELEDYSIDFVKECINRKASEICGSGRIFTDDGKCLTSNELCKRDYGNTVYAGNDGICYCISGYEWNSKGTTCVKSCPINTHYSVGSCVCDSGYTFYLGVCMKDSSIDDICKGSYGPGSYFLLENNEVRCGCSYGYVWNYARNYCVVSY